MEEETKPFFYGKQALNKLLTSYKFNTVLDVGCGQGLQADEFLRRGKKVTVVDYGTSPYYEKRKEKFDDSIQCYLGDFNTIDFKEQFDCVWACHVLEHQRNVGSFLDKVISLTKNKGVICITVPPRKEDIVGGHFTMWNGGLLLYNLVMSGLDCRDARIRRYGYNISIIVQKNRTFKLPNNLSYDVGDIQKLKGYFPAGYNQQGFNGDIRNLNWEEVEISSDKD